MEIAESIYKDLVETSYKKTTQAYSNRAGRSSNKRGESALSKTRTETWESSGKRRKRYIDNSKRESKTCLVHGPVHSSGECKVLGYFGSKYMNGKPTKGYDNHPKPR